ncbi:MAG: bifunctional phosphopantothenoylcysteine decarboxylase/phosphopantothenate--cysteine ligase CoaBC [Conexivisphaerales archaeon]
MNASTEDIKGKKGNELSQKKIVLGITGSVSAYKAADIARDLIRHGATVYAVMTPSSQKIIHPNLIQWATGNDVVTELTGKIEHIQFTSGSQKADALLIAPATANTISKIAKGIDDTPVTSYASSALGSGIPILIAPAMHDTMISQKIVQDNIEYLKTLGVQFITPVMEEGKAKLANEETITEAVISSLSPKDMRGRHVLITGGPTLEYIDPVRVITNMSSGKMAVSLAKVAKRRGADVTLVYGQGVASPPQGIKLIKVKTAEEMYEGVEKELLSLSYDLVIATAAVTDYSPDKVQNVKLRTSEIPRLTLQLHATPKIVRMVKERSPSTKLIIFKAEHSVTQQELIKRAKEALMESKADMAVANDVGKKETGFGSDNNEVFIIKQNGKVIHVPLSTKDEVASSIIDEALRIED